MHGDPAGVALPVRDDETVQCAGHGLHHRQRYSRWPALGRQFRLVPGFAYVVREFVGLFAEQSAVLLGEAPFLDRRVVPRVPQVLEAPPLLLVAQCLAQCFRDEFVTAREEAILIGIVEVEHARLPVGAVGNGVFALYAEFLTPSQLLLGQLVVLLAGIGVVVLAGIVLAPLLLPHGTVLGKGLDLAIVEIVERHAAVEAGVGHGEFGSGLSRRLRREWEGHLDSTEPIPRDGLLEVETMAAVDHGRDKQRRP